MNRVLVDTGPLYALVDPDDHHHLNAHLQLTQLIDRNLTPTVLQPILLEAYTLIMRKLGVPTAQHWMHEVDRGIDLLNPTADDYQKARARIRRYPDQAITLFDSTVATLSLQLEIPVWTFDFHFDVMGIEVWRDV